MESLRIFGILLYKCYLIRKRQWIRTLIIEIALFTSLVLCIYGLFQMSYGPPSYVTTDSHYESKSFEQMINEIPTVSHQSIMYAPSNSFTDELMKKVENCLKGRANITRFASSAELFEKWNKNGWLIALNFDESMNRSTKHLSYKYLMVLRPWFLYYLYDRYGTYAYINEFLLVENCLAESFVKMKMNNTSTTNSIPQTFLQRAPYPAHLIPRSYNEVLGLFVTIIFIIPLLIETSMATKEKFVGMNVLMTMNGISSTLNLLSWMISGLLVLIVFCSITIISMSLPHPIGFSNIYLNYSDSTVLFVLFILHLAHSIAFGMHVSIYFNTPFILSFVLVIINFLTILMCNIVFPYTNLYLTPYLGTIIPTILLCQIIDEIDYYEAMGVGVQWNNLSLNKDPTFQLQCSIGMSMMLSAVGMILHFLIAIYGYKVNPGKYGIGQHPFFFLKYKNEKTNNYNVENLTFDDVNSQYFEPISSTAYIPGIQIRHLKKVFDISIFSKKKIHALNGVSIDFYKGQITSLLGPNGAGKSTLISILTGIISSTDGIVMINSKNLKDNASEIMNDMGLCTQENMHFPNLTVIEQLEFFAMLKGKNKPISTTKKNVKTLIQRLELLDVKYSLPDKLSKDQKRKLCLGMAFVGDPSVLILDEPTSCLNYESKRVIWNMLLEMRGKKTILISTHDMEEADVLGDRIAIMYEGRLKSYGTSTFLKKMIVGQNNIDVTLTVERWSDPDRIRTQLHNEATIVEKLDMKIIVNVPISSTLRDSLDNLEINKLELGVIDYRLSHDGLEQVFLKVNEISVNQPNQFEVTTNDEVKLKGFPLIVQLIRALLVKKIKCTSKDLIIMFTQIVVVFMALLTLFIGLMLIEAVNPSDSHTIPMNLGSYYNPYTLCTSSDRTMCNQYKSISESFDGSATEITDTYLEYELLQRAKNDLIDYRTYLIAAAEFNKTENISIANAFYSDPTFSIFISISLLWNTIIKNLLGEDYSIDLDCQQFQFHPIIRVDNLIKQSNVATVLFLLPLYFVIAMFAVNPCRERAGGLKHLQMMTGISGFNYWATTFVADMMHYTLLVLILSVGLKMEDLMFGLRLYETIEILIQILLMMLFAVNVLPLVYIFSFIDNIRISTVIKLLTFIPLALVITDCLLFNWTVILEGTSDNNRYIIPMNVPLLIPYVSFMHGQMQFYVTAMLNAKCRQLLYNEPQHTRPELCDCFEKSSNDENCRLFHPYFLDDDVDSLKVSVIYLCLTPFLYFGILALLETQIIKKILVKFKKPVVPELNLDQQVQREKSMIFERIQELNKNDNLRIDRSNNLPNNPIFLAFQLEKYYGNVRAVEDVSFSINKGECFGLFGVHRSGRSTILKMISGGEILDNGVMYIDDKDLANNGKCFSSQMGYCSQHDVTVECLNSYDHLRLFAQLRGIPNDKVESEVEAWIERLNLRACASHPCRTYSTGNKRRLNIAIALIGSPKLVLLDEPTTSVDPGARCSFWNTIKICQLNGQTFLLSSNKFEECKEVCQRTAIMEDGKLIYIGTTEELKQHFGAGYHVQIRVNPVRSKTQIRKIKKYMRSRLRCTLINENRDHLMYNVEGIGTTWRKIYEVMNQIKSKYNCIDDFLIVVQLTT